MRRGRPKLRLPLTDADRQTLEQWSLGAGGEDSNALRARIILASAADETDGSIAERLGVTRQTVSKWRSRFWAEGLRGLTDRPRVGPPRRMTRTQFGQALGLLLCKPPAGAPHWSNRLLAATLGVSPSTVSRHAAGVLVAARSVDRDLLCADLREARSVDAVHGLYLNSLRVLVLGETADGAGRTAVPAPGEPRGLPGEPHPFARSGGSSLLSAVEAKVEAHARIGKPVADPGDLTQLLERIARRAPPGTGLRLVFGPKPSHDVVELPPAFGQQRRRISVQHSSSRATWLALAERWLNFIAHEQVSSNDGRNTFELREALGEFLAASGSGARAFAWP